MNRDNLYNKNIKGGVGTELAQVNRDKMQPGIRCNQSFLHTGNFFCINLMVTTEKKSRNETHA